jgi:hypothetical protein
MERKNGGMKIIFKWIGRIVGYGFLAFIALIGILIVYEMYFPWEDKAREREFNRRLEQKISDGEEKIYLKDLTDFEWEKLFFMGAEYTNEDLNQMIGFEYNGYIPSIWCDPFDKSDLVFVKDERVIIIPIPQCKTEDHCTHIEGKWGDQCQDDAFLRVVKDNLGAGVTEIRYILEQGN